MTGGAASSETTPAVGPGDDGWVGATAVSSYPIIDWFEVDDGTVVMVESGAVHRIVRLSPLGSEVLEAIGDGTTLDELEDAMLERLGSPPDGDLARAVRDAVRALAGAGLLSATVPSCDVT